MRDRFAIELLASLAAFALAGREAHAEGCKIAIFAELPVAMEGLRASVPVRINTHQTSFWLDSGAWFSIMSKAKAAELGLSVKPITAFDIRMYGIGGSFDPYLTRISSFGFAKADLKNVDFMVGGSDSGNALIGSNILGFRDAEFDLAHGSVKLTDATGCKVGSLSYWAPGEAYFTVPMTNTREEPHAFRLTVTINGAKVDAEFDTGADTTLLSRAAAERAKIDLKGPGVAKLDGVSGFGRKIVGGWSVPVDDVGIGDEHILRTRMDVIDGPIESMAGAPEMLLGADFALAHHIYVSRRLHQFIFTYTGGRPFIASQPAPRVAKQAASPNAGILSAEALPAGMHRVQAVAGAAGAPKTAEAFVARGKALLAQRDYSAAIADFTEAIRLAPDRWEYYRDRSAAYSASEKGALAEADVDKALALNPNDGDLLVERAAVRLDRSDRPGALADAEAAAKLFPAASLQMSEAASLLAQTGEPGRAALLLGPVIAAHSSGDSHLGDLLNARCWYRGLANVELAAALDDCNRAIKGYGAAADVLDSRALIRYRQKDWTGAITDYDAALKSEEKSPWTLFMRGAAKIAKGDTAAGKADQDAAKAIAPKIAERVARYGLP